MIDLHLHCLPALDDGAADLAAAVAMCRRAAAEGCEVLVATPHQRRDEWPRTSPAAVARAVGELQAAVGERPRILPGAEVRVDSELLGDFFGPSRDGILTLAGSRYLLLEFEPFGIGPEPVDLVRELAEGGFVPIVAHPEVTPFFGRLPSLLARMIEAGARLQLTAASVVGEFGKQPRERAEELLEADLVDFVGSDAHGADWRPPGLRKAWSVLERRWGPARAQRLLVDNPRAVVENRALPALPLREAM